jgi:trk system potassium uptake protein TrkA
MAADEETRVLKIIIVGAGEVGFHIASHLARENKDVVVVDRDAEALRRVADHLDVQVVQGSGGSPPVLEEAGIHSAEILLAVTDSDEANLVACLVANILSPSTKKLARLRLAAYDAYHETFRAHAPHIDTVINPEIEVVKTIRRMLQVPGAVDVANFADGRLRFVGIHMDDNVALSGVPLFELPTRLKEERPLIAAIMRNEELIIPRGRDRLLPGDLVYFICERDKLERTLAVFEKQSAPLKRILIVGGGRLGHRLAAALEKEPVSCKIVERQAERCELLAERLNKTVVLHGDGSDQALLAEENVGDMDAVVTLTSDEETNILISLLTRRMGVRKCITRISKFSYFPLMATIGIEQVVSPRLSAISSILQHVRRGKVLSAVSIKGEQAEVLEAMALETSDIVARPLKNVGVPKGALIAGIMRQEQIIIPSGETVIQPGDRVIIVARREAIPKIEKMLAVKLEFF